MPPSFTTLTDRLRQRLQGDLPGREAQFTMAPRFRQNETLASVADKACREAGVLALLFPLDHEPALLLTVRRPDLEHHPGQISFPGGRLEPGESSREAALREAHEEVALDPASVDLLGALTPLYIPPSNFCVYPYVGAVYEMPMLRPMDAEVADILYAPLDHLIHPDTRTTEVWSLHGGRVRVPFFSVDGHQVWGATAMMLAELLEVYRSVEAAS